MKTLEQDWLTRVPVDFEYKQYILLAYCKDIRQQFDHVHLYPYLSDLVAHYQSLLALRQQKQQMEQQFPQQLAQADLDSLTLRFARIAEDDSLLQEIEDIISFALPQFKSLLEEGKDIYEYIAQHLAIQPIGITPLRQDYGYFMLATREQRDVQVYEYQITFFENAREQYRSLQTRFLETVVRSLFQTLENLKLELIRKYRHIAHPATYLIESAVVCPTESTLLPVAKRSLMKYLGNQG